MRISTVVDRSIIKEQKRPSAPRQTGWSVDPPKGDERMPAEGRRKGMGCRRGKLHSISLYGLRTLLCSDVSARWVVGVASRGCAPCLLLQMYFWHAHLLKLRSISTHKPVVVTTVDF